MTLLSPSFSPAERAVVAALAQTALPSGRELPGAGADAPDRVEAALATFPDSIRFGYRGLVRGLDLFARATTRRGFAALPADRRSGVLRSLERSEATRLAARGLLVILKAVHFEDRRPYEALGCRYSVDPPAPTEPPSWHEQVVAGESLVGADPVECDVVVVGSGAGGAPLASRLAARGHAVLLLEEGEHYTRRDFTGRPVDMLRKLYVDSGATIAYGNTAIPIPIGRGVGGTTLVNSGTCYRAPESTLEEWRRISGISDLTPHALAPWYEEVERVLQVAPSSEKALGMAAKLIARGCDALGYRHRALARNAPDCDGQGLCCFGCPTDAKRSTNLSFVPLALQRGAQLATGVRVDRVVVERGRAVGVEGTVRKDGRVQRLRVRARATVIAAGALGTPAMLLRQGLASRSGQVGRNLSIHPSAAAMGIFDEEVRPFDCVPQGWAIEEFEDEGLLYEGGNLPLQIVAAMTQGHGPAWSSLVEDARRGVIFGFLVKETSRGRVTVGPGGRTMLWYWLNDRDLARMRRGIGILCRVFLAAGARAVVPGVAGWERLESLRDVERLEAARYPARHVDITAYHPAGTCRMGTDPRRSVVGPTHETHDVPGLFVCDASSLPGPPGVNPQMTIMALSLRAADAVERLVAG